MAATSTPRETIFVAGLLTLPARNAERFLVDLSDNLALPVSEHVAFSPTAILLTTIDTRAMDPNHLPLRSMMGLPKIDKPETLMAGRVEEVGSHNVILGIS